MKNIILAIASFIATIAFLSQLAFAQEDSANRQANPGTDPSEEIKPDGASFANYGCTDPTGSCYSRQWSNGRHSYTLKPKTPVFAPNNVKPPADSDSKGGSSDQR